MADMLQNDDIGIDGIGEEDTTKDLYLTFDINGEYFAIDVINIKEIITMCAVTLVPEAPDYVKGIINLRGDIVPVISVRARFGIEEIEYDEATCIVVLDFDEYIIGLIVDKVEGVLTIPEENISLPPHVKLSHSNQFIKSVGRTEVGVKLILDIYKLLF